MKTQFTAISLFLFLYVFPTAFLSAQETVSLRPLAPLPKVYQAQILLPDNSAEKKAPKWTRSSFLLTEVDGNFGYDSYKFLEAEDIKSIEKEFHPKMGCSPAVTLLKISSKNPLTIRNTKRFSSTYGIGKLYHIYNKSFAPTYSHQFQLLKRIPRYELFAYGEVNHFGGSKSEEHFRQYETRLSFEQNNLFDYKLKIGGYAFLNHMSNGYISHFETLPDKFRKEQFFNYFLKPSASFQIFPFLTSGMEVRAFSSDSYEFDEVSGEEINGYLDFDKKLGRKHYLQSRIQMGRRILNTRFTVPIFLYQQELDIEYKLGKHLRWELDYLKTQHKTPYTDKSPSLQYFEGGLGILSKEFSSKTSDSPDKRRNKVQIELLGQIANLESSRVDIEAFELGSKLQISGKQKIKLGIAYRFSDFQFNPNGYYFSLDFFQNRPRLFREYQEKGFHAQFQGEFRLASVYFDLTANYRRDNAFAKESTNLETSIYWRSFSLHTNWEAFKGWHITAMDENFSRLTKVALYYKFRNFDLPGIESLHFKFTAQNLFFRGKRSILFHLRSFERGNHPYFVPDPLATNLLAGISLDFK